MNEESTTVSHDFDLSQESSSASAEAFSAFALLLAACAYLLWKHHFGKSSCSSGCGSCGGAQQSACRKLKKHLQKLHKSQF